MTILDQRRSIKTLATALKPALQSGDGVASCHTYYIEVVGWRGELRFTRSVSQDSGGWMIAEKTFSRQWRSAQRFYPVTDRATCSTLVQTPPEAFYWVVEDSYEVAPTNQQSAPNMIHAAIKRRVNGAPPF